MGFELRELALPETEDVGRDVAEFGDFADAEVEFVRDVRPGCGEKFCGLAGAGPCLKLQYRYAGIVSCCSGRCKYRPLKRRRSQFFLERWFGGKAERGCFHGRNVVSVSGEMEPVGQ